MSCLLYQGTTHAKGPRKDRREITTEQDFLPRKINYNRLALLRDLHHLHSLNKAAASDVSLPSSGEFWPNPKKRGEARREAKLDLEYFAAQRLQLEHQRSSQQFALLLPSIPFHPNSISVTKLK